MLDPEAEVGEGTGEDVGGREGVVGVKGVDVEETGHESSVG